MNLTELIRELENQLKSAEKFARKYDSEASALRNKLTGVANIVGRKLAVAGAKVMSDGNRAMSSAGRARIIAAQKKRWAAYRSKVGGAVKSVATKIKKKTRGSGMSAAGRAKIAAAQKKRWAAFHKSRKSKK